MKAWPLAAAILLLGAANVALARMARPEPPLVRAPLGDLPLHLAGAWEGSEIRIDARTLELLQLTDHVMRVYLPAAGGRTDSGGQTGSVDRAQEASVAPVILYVGYYDDQRTGATYHSPKNCLPGGGWQIAESGTTALSGREGARFRVNRVVIEKEFDRQLVLYWYQDRGRSIDSEYAAKLYLIWDAMTRNRTDGALVRVSTPVVGTAEEAEAHLVRFLDDAWPLLLARLPS
jgi:EpsI family protein